MRLFNFLLVAALSGLATAPALAQKATHTRLLSSPPGATKLGETVKLLAEVDGLGGGVPMGAVTFRDGSVSLASVALSAYTPGTGALSVGSAHSCALTVKGGVKCWGRNYTGELGDGTTTERHAPVDVSGLSSGVVEISAGDGHTCALTYAGAVKCWGFGASGQLGDGTTEFRRLTPVDVKGLASGVVAISAGSYHTCALTNAGAVKCWGADRGGQVGDGGPTEAGFSTPVDVAGLSGGVVAISAGAFHTCAVTSAGVVWCWGENAQGQLGDGTRWLRTAPVSVSGLSSVIKIYAGSGHTCALTTAGAVKCWGENAQGQLGDGTSSSRNAPVSVLGLSSGVFAVAAGGYHNCALTSTGAAKCWGANSLGQLGDGTTVSRPTPVAVSGLSSGAVSISADSASCAQIINGAVKCWGNNFHGQLGDGSRHMRLTPVTIRQNLGTLVRARATTSTTALGVAVHPLSASYAGGATHASSGNWVWHRVDPATPGQSSSITAIPR
jgi:alpha-tubulin suppressor-like RCC1 family protein